jgi:hypothetical protein
MIVLLVLYQFLNKDVQKADKKRICLCKRLKTDTIHKYSLNIIIVSIPWGILILVKT